MTKLHHEDQWEVQRVETLLTTVLEGLGEPLEVDYDSCISRVTIYYAKWKVTAVLDPDADGGPDGWTDLTRLISYKLERRP